VTEFIKKRTKFFSKPFSKSAVEPLSDKELMVLVQENDQEAFRVLFDKYKGPIVSFIYNMTKNPGISEDLAQTSFMKVYKSRGSYRSEYKFTTWLWTIARNTTYDYLRKKKEISIERFRSEDGKEFEIEDEAMGVEEKLVLESDKAIVMNCLDNMKVSQKEALNLRIFSEQSYDEIAETLNITLSATKSLINRSKMNLIKCVKECLEKGEVHE